jgi:pimeloyl-ACP methyl ester carboxylesterase
MINATLVTIHGFWSSSETWGQLNTIWQEDEQLGLQIHPFNYPSPKKPRWPFSPTRIPDYDDIAQTLATEYEVALADVKNIAIVTHSQGGLIAQRFLAWMLGEGRGRELARIQSIIMLACPNGGSEYLRSIRHVLGYGRHPQAGDLEVLNRRAVDTQRAVLRQIVNATGVDDHQCRIPLHVYAGNSDKIVTAASAQATFPGASTLAGNHFSILDPTSPGNRTAETVKHHLIADLSASYAQSARRVPLASDIGQSTAEPPIGNAELPVNGYVPDTAQLTPPLTSDRGRTVTDRWCHTSDGGKVPALMGLTHTGMLHPGYGARQAQDEPPSVKLGMLVACKPIGPSSSGSELRAKFITFLNSAAVHQVIEAHTYVASGMSWKNLAGHGPRTLEAALTAGDDAIEGIPIASALLLPPIAGESLYGRSSDSATLILYIEPRTAAGRVPPASDLAGWFRRFNLTLTIPDAFAEFLSKDLGLGAFDDPPAQLGIWLKSHQPLTSMIDTRGLQMLPGSPPSNQFIGWAFADRHGKSISETTRDLLIQLCEYTLHLDSFEQTLAEGEVLNALDIASWRAAITQALWEYNEALNELSWTRSPSHDGGYYDPDWDIELPNEFEDVQLVAIDGPSDIMIDASGMEFDKPVICTYRVTLSFTGFMEKFNWYGMEDEDDLFLMDGDWNDHYVSADAVRTIKLTTKVVFDSATGEASVEEVIAVIRVRRPLITNSDAEA